MCVISLGVSSPNSPDRPTPSFQDFSRGLARIREDLLKFNFQGDFIPWDQHYPEGSPTQQQIHGAYKPFCFYEVQQRGYQLVLWMDASIKIRKPLEPLFALIKQDGYLMFQESHSVGAYCKDEALKLLGITREESFKLPSCWSCVLGLDLSNQRSVEFLRQWKERASDGITFPGPKWSGVKGWPRTASQDPRVHGHRCDQTSASVIAIKLGMAAWKSKEYFSEFFNNERDYVRKYQEYKNDTVLKQTWRFGKRLLRECLFILKRIFK
jgi:hypothetical protein